MPVLNTVFPLLTAMSRRFYSRRALMFSAILLCAGASQGLADPIIKDAFGREVTIGSSQKILTLGSDISEIVVTLGAEDRIISVDRGSSYPATLRSKPNVGYRRSLSAEGIIALAPDLILASEDVGPVQAVDILKALSVPMVFIPEKNSLEGMLVKIDLISRALHVEDRGQALASSVRKDFETAAALASNIPVEQRKKVVFFHGLLKLTGAGRETAAGAIIDYAGGANPFDFQGYKQVSEERLIELAPDVIVMMPDGRGGPKPEEVFAIPALGATPAAKNKALIVLEGAYMINFGPRTASAIRTMAQALYPAAGTPDLQ